MKRMENVNGMRALYPRKSLYCGRFLGLRSSRRLLMATGFRVHANPADSADTPRQTHAHRTRCGTR